MTENGRMRVIIEYEKKCKKEKRRCGPAVVDAVSRRSCLDSRLVAILDGAARLARLVQRGGCVWSPMDAVTIHNR